MSPPVSIRDCSCFGEMKEGFIKVIKAPTWRMTLCDPAHRASNRTVEELARDFVRSHWAGVEKAGGPFAGSQVERSTGGFCDTKYRDEVKDFFSAHKLSAGERTLKQSLERINNCIDLKSLQSDQLASWLQHQSSSAGN
jgi:hypothetical protein